MCKKFTDTPYKFQKAKNTTYTTEGIEDKEDLPDTSMLEVKVDLKSRNDTATDEVSKKQYSMSKVRLLR